MILPVDLDRTIRHHRHVILKFCPYCMMKNKLPPTDCIEVPAFYLIDYFKRQREERETNI